MPLFGEVANSNSVFVSVGWLVGFYDLLDEPVMGNINNRSSCLCICELFIYLFVV